MYTALPSTKYSNRIFRSLGSDPASEVTKKRGNDTVVSGNIVEEVETRLMRGTRRTRRALKADNLSNNKPRVH